MILDGLKRIVGSAKVQLLASAAFGAAMTYLMTPGTAAEKRGLLETMVYALAALVGAVILGWAHEDASAKASPAQQVNVGSKVDNVAPPAAVVPPPAPVPVPDPQQQLVEDVYTQVLHRLEARAAAQNKARAAALAAQQAAAAVIPEPPKGE